MSQFLFLYGTLLPGAAPPEISEAVSRLRFVAEASIAGLLYDVGDFPGAVLDENCCRRIWGGVFELPPDPTVLRVFDEYEGFDPRAPGRSQFVRSRAIVRHADGRECECWMYLYNRDTSGAQLIESGRWRSER